MGSAQDGLANSLTGMARRRELGTLGPRAVQRAMHFPESAVRRLSIEAILRGHHGCVNRLSWNESGSLLASGSDDRKIMLWSYPDTQRQPVCVETEHQANIFGVRFLPQTNDTRLVTGAMDYTVQLHQLETPPASMQLPVCGGGTMRHRPATAFTAASVRTVVYTCHRSRVKDVAVEPLNPHLFWSAAEDGTVRQFDTRMHTSQQREFDSPNLLLAVKSKGRFSELKSLNLNPAKPNQLAVAAADPLLRIYDRRMLSTGPPDSRRAGAPPLLALAPPHLALCAAGGSGGRSARMHATYASFSNRGDKVVATYHGDHAYCFDVSGAAPTTAVPSSTNASSQEPGPYNLFAHPAAVAALAAGSSSALGASSGSHVRKGTNRASSSSSNGYGSGCGGMGNMPGMLPAAAERAKADGNLHLFSKQHYEAVRKYSEAIRLAPWAPVLYTNRALALLQRGWEGDAMCALRDAETAVSLDPVNSKAHYRRLQALRAVGMLQSATMAVRLFKQHFPDQADDVEGVEEQIELEVRCQLQQAELRQQQAEQRRQLRRRRGMQFDREQQQRRQVQQGTDGEPTATATSPVDEPAAAAAAGTGEADVGPAAAVAAAPAAGAAAMPAAVQAVEALAIVPAAAPAASGDAWDDPYASASSGEEDDEDSAAAGAGAAASSGLDIQYAVALEAAAAGTSTAGKAAAAGDAPTIDGVAGAERQRQRQQAAGARNESAVRQPSLWNAFEGGRRMLQRYVGQCNLQTDIKEAVFLGVDDALVAAGSDDGRVFIFATGSGECVRVIMADEDVANAVQPHPHLPVLATSGIESTIKLWSPEGEPTGSSDVAEIVRCNQERLKGGPTVLRGVDPRIIAALTDNPDLLRALMQRASRRPAGGQSGSSSEAGHEGEEGEEAREVSCRMA